VSKITHTHELGIELERLSNCRTWKTQQGVFLSLNQQHDRSVTLVIFWLPLGAHIVDVEIARVRECPTRPDRQSTLLSACGS